MRRSITWMAVPFLTVGLSACGSGDSEGESATETSTASSQTTTTRTTTTQAPTTGTSTSSGTSTSQDSSSSTTTPSSSTTTPSSTTSDGGGSGGATNIAQLWVDDTWSVETVKEDLCATGGLTTSAYSHQVELFTCGPTAASVKACTYADGGQTTCITDPVGHQAIRFTSPTVDNWDGEMHERGTGPIPMYVELEDGAQCSVVSHDHDQHWNGKLSWYSCDDGSELLTDESIEGTFDDDAKAWTVQRSVDKGKPATTWVKTAVFAGTR